MKDPAVFATNFGLDGAPVSVPIIAEIRPPRAHVGFGPTEHAASARNDIVKDPAVFATNFGLNRAPMVVPRRLEVGLKSAPAAGDVAPHIESTGLNLCPNPVFAGYACFNTVPTV